MNRKQGPALILNLDLSSTQINLQSHRIQMIQKLSLPLLLSSRSEEQSLSFSSIEGMNTDLVAKIVELEAQLYRAHMDNQDLRQRRSQLQGQLQRKKRSINGVNNVKVTKRGYKHHRNLSQPTIEIEKDEDTQRQRPGEYRLFFKSPSRDVGHPITGDELNFDKLKGKKREDSFKARNTPQEYKTTNLSSPRTVGIKKNISKLSNQKVSQNEQNIDREIFKSIEEIWNNTKKTDSYLQKSSSRASYKKKSYLNY